MDENMNYDQDVQEYEYGSSDGVNPSEEGTSYSNQQPVYQTNNSNGLAIAGMVCGIVALVVVCCFFPVSIICAIAGIVLSIIALNKQQSKGMSIAGIVTSAIAMFLALIVILLMVVFSSTIVESIPDYVGNGIYEEYYYNELYDELYDNIYDFY